MTAIWLGLVLALAHVACLWLLAGIKATPLAVQDYGDGNLGIVSDSNKLRLFADGQAVDSFEEALRAPGTRRLEWRNEYAGGFVRSVGVTRLVGPFIPSGSKVCGLDLLIRSSLVGGPQSSIGETVTTMIEAPSQVQPSGNCPKTRNPYIVPQISRVY